MKPIVLSVILTFLLSFFFGAKTFGQIFGTESSGIYISDCNQDNFFNTSGTGPALIGPSTNVFTSANLGAHTQNSGTLILRGAEVRTFKLPAVSNVCSVRMYYRVYLQSGTPGSFNSIDLSLLDDCDVPGAQYPSGGFCIAGNQKWNRVIMAGVTTPYAPVNLTSIAAGNYVLEVYYEVSGSSASTTLCDETVVLNNSGNNYKALFFIQAPVVASNNPSTCNGTEGSVTISGLMAGATYAVSYFDGGIAVAPANYVANSSGQVIISGLDAGTYSNFELLINGCITELYTGIILSNPLFTPSFNRIAPFCAGSISPTLSATSNNGIMGTWNPSVIDNMNSGAYTFTPIPGQCGMPVTINVIVTPKAIPSFSFGTSLSICAGAVVPSLPNTSTNGINGTWSPSSVDNQNTATYTFTPAAGRCAAPTSFSVTVTPNVVPAFSFGTSLSVCAGTGVPALPGTSNNNITGTWSPSNVDNQNSGNYTFTPTTGQCATATIFNVTINPNITPTFSFGSSLTICAGASVATLPVTSDDGITGSWNPSTINNQSSGVYTFTPTAGLCATTTTFAVTVAPNIVPAFSFGTSLNICAGENVPLLSNTSTNNINGTWNPSVVDNQSSGTYTFTPSAGQCATITTFSVTVSPNITPTFSFGTSLFVCAGSGVPNLPGSSSNGIIGTWSPSAVDNQNSGTYTFTPTNGQCATITTFNVTVDAKATPVFSFSSSLSICAGAGVPSLPATSTNGITGSWNPTAINNQSSGVYTFTPTSGLCATTSTFNVTVEPNIVPAFSFGTSLNICAGGNVPLLPNTSTNNINGTWSPSVVDNQSSGTYTFTPSAGQCATTATFTVTVNSNITPTFSFGIAQTICAGATVPVLPITSTNNITGSWNPSTVDNQNSSSYTFTPTAGKCATTTTFTVTVNSNVPPTFSFGSSLAICAGASVPALPVTSTNSITGTWNPSTIDNNSSGVYTFRPTAGLCASTTTFTVTVNSIITPTFSFGTAQTICAGGFVPSLPNTSTNSVSGTWNPAAINNQGTGTYTFTPAAGQCATTATFTVTVTPIVTPTFSFGTAMTICSDSDVPVLPATSINNISGTWSPAILDNKNSGTYMFTPAAGQCGSTTTFVLNVTPTITPVFDFGTELTICTGANVPLLPATSTNGIAGTWNASTVDNRTSAIYTFTPIATPAQCITNATFTVTVKPILVPLFSFGETQTICTGSTVPVLPAISSNGITGTWAPADVSNQVSGTYTFTSAANECAMPTATFTVTITPVATGTVRSDTTVYDGAIFPAANFSGTPAGVNYSWTNSNTAIGLGASGNGSIASFAAVNNGTTPVTATITMTPTINNCAGTSRTYVITVKPLDKDVFVPNVFSPNGDGKNDLFMAYGNYIDKLNMSIFNQWGQKLITIDKPNKGWDGTFNGKAQPVGVYVYELQAVLTDGRVVKLKGYITLVR